MRLNQIHPRPPLAGGVFFETAAPAGSVKRINVLFSVAVVGAVSLIGYAVFRFAVG